MNVLFRLVSFLIIAGIASCSSASEQSSQHGPDGPTTRCDKWERPLPKDSQGRTVVIVENGCSGFYNGVKVAIDLVFADGTRTTVFEYKDASWNAAYYGQTAPVVEWTGDSRLKISVGAVAAVERKIEKLRDVEIQYNIGTILYK